MAGQRVQVALQVVAVERELRWGGGSQEGVSQGAALLPAGPPARARRLPGLLASRRAWDRCAAVPAKDSGTVPTRLLSEKRSQDCGAVRQAWHTRFAGGPLSQPSQPGGASSPPHHRPHAAILRGDGARQLVVLSLHGTGPCLAAASKPGGQRHWRMATGRLKQSSLAARPGKSCSAACCALPGRPRSHLELLQCLHLGNLLGQCACGARRMCT